MLDKNGSRFVFLQCRARRQTVCLFHVRVIFSIDDKSKRVPPVSNDQRLIFYAKENRSTNNWDSFSKRKLIFVTLSYGATRDREKGGSFQVWLIVGGNAPTVSRSSIFWRENWCSGRIEGSRRILEMIEIVIKWGMSSTKVEVARGECSVCLKWENYT